jgi:hypothetical protein
MLLKQVLEGFNFGRSNDFEDPGASGVATLDWEHYNPDTGNVIPFNITVQYKCAGTDEKGNPDPRTLDPVRLVSGVVNGKTYDAATLVKLFGADCFEQSTLQDNTAEWISNNNETYGHQDTLDVQRRNSAGDARVDNYLSNADFGK